MAREKEGDLTQSYDKTPLYQQKVASGKWQVANGKWQMASDKWQVANGK